VDCYKSLQSLFWTSKLNQHHVGTPVKHMWVPEVRLKLCFNQEKYFYDNCGLYMTFWGLWDFLLLKQLTVTATLSFLISLFLIDIFVKISEILRHKDLNFYWMIEPIACCARMSWNNQVPINDGRLNNTVVQKQIIINHVSI
jgi:hypothetical protein